jgi:hypothetical protein
LKTLLPGLVTDLLPAINAAFSEVWDVGPDGLPRRPGDNTAELHDDSKRSVVTVALACTFLQRYR